MWWRDPSVFARDGTLGGGLVAGLFFALEFLFLFLGLQWTSASHAVLFLYTSPLFVALGLIWIAPDERLRRWQWGGLVMAFSGVAVALGVSLNVSVEMLIGDVLCLIGGIMWALTTLTLKATRLRYASASKVLLYQLVVSSVLLTPAALLKGERLSLDVSAQAWGLIAYQTIWVGAVTFMGWMWLIANYRAGELSALTFTTPVLGVVAAWLIMGDPVPLSFALAVVLTVAGITLVNWPRKPPAVV
jgi:drug/metabolite transporter (DMT)-like permease